MAYEFSWVEIRDMWWTFNKYDVDASGSLSKTEVQQLVKTEIKNVTAEDFNWILLLVDQGGTSGVPFSQYVHIVEEFGKRGYRTKPQSTQQHFSYEDIDFLQKLFISCDKTGDKMLDFAELTAAIDVFKPKPNTSAATTAIIKRLAIERSGWISFEEFLKGLAFSDIPYKEVTRDRANRNVQINVERDANNSKATPKLSVVKSNMAELPDKLKSDALRVFNAADVDRSGAIDGDEFFNALRNLFPKMTRPECNRLYVETDTNRSGLVTYDEFLDAAIQFQWDLMRLHAPPAPTTATYEWEIPFKELELGPILGEGSFGIVHKGKWRGTSVAVKVLKFSKSNDDILQDFRREIAFLGKLRHPHVVLFMGAATQPPNVCMVTEFLSGGSLYDVLHKRKKKLDMKSILRIALQTARALNHLHLSGIIHRDVKSMNILIDEAWNLKVIDFGLSAIKPSATAMLNEQVGSPLWMAPELLAGKSYNEKVDVYSFAICMWELLTNSLPYSGMDLIGVVNHVARLNKRPTIPATTPHQLSQLITQCWDAKPENRPTFENVIKQLEQLAKVLV